VQKEKPAFERVFLFAREIKIDIGLIILGILYFNALYYNLH